MPNFFILNFWNYSIRRDSEFHDQKRSTKWLGIKYLNFFVTQYSENSGNSKHLLTEICPSKESSVSFSGVDFFSRSSHFRGLHFSLTFRIVNFIIFFIKLDVGSMASVTSDPSWVWIRLWESFWGTFFAEPVQRSKVCCFSIRDFTYGVLLLTFS